MEIEISCGSCQRDTPQQDITLIVHLKKNKNKIMARIACVLFMAAAFLVFAKATELFEQPIENATVEQIQEVDGIGPVLAQKVYFYVHSKYWTGNFDDLGNNINGIGKTRLKKLEYHFK